MKLKIVQLTVSKNISANKAKIIEALQTAEKDEWLIFPEALLSGYYPNDPEYTDNLDWDLLSEHLHEIKELTVRMKCHCLVGSATKENGEWRNSILVFSYLEEDQSHHKIELSALDKKHFTPGDSCTTHRVGDITFGIQACREVLFPRHWSNLKADGAQVIFHINNALHPKDALWQHVLITRAIENGIFVVSVNNAEHPQALPSFLINPGGEILEKTVPQTEQITARTISLDEVIPDLSVRTDF